MMDRWNPKEVCTKFTATIYSRNFGAEEKRAIC